MTTATKTTTHHETADATAHPLPDDKRAALGALRALFAKVDPESAAPDAETDALAGLAALIMRMLTEPGYADTALNIAHRAAQPTSYGVQPVGYTGSASATLDAEQVNTVFCAVLLAVQGWDTCQDPLENQHAHMDLQTLLDALQTMTAAKLTSMRPYVRAHWEDHNAARQWREDRWATRVRLAEEQKHTARDHIDPASLQGIGEDLVSAGNAVVDAQARTSVHESAEAGRR